MNKDNWKLHQHLSISVSGNLKTNGNQGKPGNYFAFLLMETRGNLEIILPFY
jgi:hypothetical protein